MRSSDHPPIRSSIRRIMYVFFIALTISSVPFSDFISEVSADGGFIPRIRLDVHESAQNAIIVFDGGVERLYLSVNIKADREVEGFHIIPFPSMPRITLCNLSIFSNLTDSLNSKLILPYSGRDTIGIGGNVTSITIKLLETLGDHKITVIKIEDPTDFKDDLREISQFLGINISEWPEGLDGTIQSYVDRGIRYFTIDQYSVGVTDRTMDPLVFEFNSKEAYFPLQISSLFKGKGQIDVTLITPDDLALDLGPSGRFDQELEFHLTSQELSWIDRSLTERIPGDANVYHFTMKTDLSDLKGDLVIPVNMDIASCRMVNFGQMDTRSVTLRDMMITIYPNEHGIVGLSLPGLVEEWNVLSPSFSYLSLQKIDLSGEEILLAASRWGIQRIDPENGTILWSCDCSGKIDTFPYVRSFDYHNGPLINVNDAVFVDPDTGEVVREISVEDMSLGTGSVINGNDEIKAYDDQIHNECYLYSPFITSYFDPRDGESHNGVWGKIPLYGGSVVLKRIWDEEYLTGRTMDLEEVLGIDDYVNHLNLTGIEDYDLTTRTFCDPDFGIVRLNSPRNSSVSCFDEGSSQVRWERNIGSWTYPHASFIDMDFDGTEEMYLYDEMDPTQSLILESDGTIYLDLNGFLPSLPIKRTDNAYVLAGRWNDSFCCYDLTDRSMRYYYPLPEETANHFWDMTVFDWDEDGARVVFGISNDAGFILYRTGPTGFEYLTTMTKGGSVIDLGSSIGISVPGGRTSSGRMSRIGTTEILYTVPYNGIMEDRTYPSIDVPEDNMGIDGLQKYVQGPPIDGTDTEVGGRSIPFLGPMTIVIIAIMVTFVMGRHKDSRESSKRSQLSIA